MRISEIRLPRLPSLGLKAINMERLGRIVVIAGKNGAGKTRLLGRIAAWTNERIFEKQTRSEFCARFWEEYPSARAQFGQLPRNGWWRDDTAWEAFVRFTDFDGKRRSELEKIRPELFQLEFEGGELPEIVRFVPRGVNITDPTSLTKAQLQESAIRAQTIGVSEMDKRVLPRIQWLQDRWWNATHPDSRTSDADRLEAVERYETMRKMVERALRTQLNRNVDGEPTLFGFPIGKAHLSDGQRIVLQFCVALSAQAHKLSEQIVLLDEPENSLHPEAMLDAIFALDQALTKGQMWIATHSVPLLSAFDPDNIWWMEDSQIRHAGSQPEAVLAGLIGDEERIGQLNAFLGLPAELAAINFAKQCLVSPEPVLTSPDDPQLRQIKRLLGKVESTEPLRVLDFGAGRGRLASALHEVSSVNSQLPVDYFAFDSHATHRDECEAAVARLYGSATNRCFYSESDAATGISHQSIDVVVMCNVLHEIDPLNWASLFGPDGLIHRLLAPSGYLLVVEDTEMRVGEKAHARGYLVLEAEALKRLFQTPGSEIASDKERDGRLQAHIVPARYLHSVDSLTVRSALEFVRSDSARKIRILRESNDVHSYRQGRRHANLVQQLANAQLALNALDEQIAITRTR